MMKRYFPTGFLSRGLVILLLVLMVSLRVNKWVYSLDIASEVCHFQAQLNGVSISESPAVALALPVSLASTLFLTLAILVLAYQRPGYNHRRHTISELGEVGTPGSRWVSWGVFLPVGLCLTYIAFAIKLVAPTVSLLAACVAVGYLAAAVFPCDPGSPLSGTLRQGLHTVGGGVEYVGGAYALWQMGSGQPTSLLHLSALVVGLVALLLSGTAFLSIRGLLQRIAEGLLFGWLIYSLAVIPPV